MRFHIPITARHILVASALLICACDTAKKNDDNGDGPGSHIGSWSGPQTIGSGSFVATGASAAMDDNGNAIVAWTENSDGPYAQVYVHEYRDGSWASPVAVHYGSFVASGAAVAMDNDGNAIVTWTDNSDGPYAQVYVYEYRSGGWSAPIAVHYGSFVASGATAAMDDNGNAIVTWTDNSDGPYAQVYVYEYRSGGWSAPIAVHYGSFVASGPAVAMDNDGNALMAWTDNSDGPYAQVYVYEYRSGGWSAPIAVHYGSFVASGATAAMDDNGNALVGWSENSDGPYAQVNVYEYRNSSWSGPQTFGSGSFLASGVTTAMDDNGNALVGWSENSDGPYAEINLYEYRSGSWSGPQSFRSGSFVASGVTTAMDNNGNALVGWSENSDGPYGQIQLYEYRNESWSGPQNIGSGSFVASGVATAMDQDGNAIVTWSENSDGPYGQIQLYEYR